MSAGRAGALRVLAPAGLATFLGAGLLFLVEPMASKALLPLLGGSASVWTVSLVFYQALLLLGYGYAHLLSRRLPGRAGVMVHVAVVALAAVRLPFHGFTASAGPG